MTVFETVAYPLRIRRRPRAEIASRVERMLELVGLTGFADRHASRLSGGQQQRVALARALVYEPSVLLLDEPFSSLDVKLREQLRLELRLLQRRIGVTVVIVTHDQVEALTLADSVAVMRDGRVEQVASPRDIYTLPSSAFVRDFVGRSVLLRGTLRERVSDGSAVVDLWDTPLRILCPPDLAAAPGDAVDLSLRPEDVRFLAPGVSTAGMAVFPGVIRAALFGGDRVECVVAVGGTVIEAFAPREQALRDGQSVSVGLPLGAVRLWQIATPRSHGMLPN
jgi:ABC-type Fe3+/spermidine/putrescine transport system ATPase subunit